MLCSAWLGVGLGLGLGLGLELGIGIGLGLGLESGLQRLEERGGWRRPDPC